MVSLAGGLAFCTPLLAQQQQDVPEFAWRAYDLHAPEANRTYAYGISEVDVSGTQIWKHFNSELSGQVLWYWPLDVRFRKLGLLNSIWDADRYYQTGQIEDPEYPGGGVAHAAIWFASLGEDILDMHPDGANTSEIYDLHNGIFTGNIYVKNNRNRFVTHAVVWPNASPGNMVDIHPVWSTGAGASQGEATDGTWFGGEASSSERGRMVATLWKGMTPESAINMDPPDSDFRGSYISGMAPGVQVGNVLRSTGKDNAVLWHGSPESLTIMHPPSWGNTNSYMYGTLGWIHIGQVSAQAGYWIGDDPESFVSLDPYLPEDAGASKPFDVDVVDNKLIIVGETDWRDYRQHAIVWIGTPTNETARHFLRQTEGREIEP